MIRALLPVLVFAAVFDSAPARAQPETAGESACSKAFEKLMTFKRASSQPILIAAQTGDRAGCLAKITEIFAKAPQPAEECDPLRLSGVSGRLRSMILSAYVGDVTELGPVPAENASLAEVHADITLRIRKLYELKCGLLSSHH
jgi:hypothetical protein